MFSQQSRYALKALIYLAKQDKSIAISSSIIAEKADIPKKFLEAILLELKNEGIISSKMGKYGGYFLMKSAASISFAEVIRIIEGPISPIYCVSKFYYKKCDDCKNQEECELHIVMLKARDAFLDVLENSTIEDSIMVSNL